MCQTSVWRRTLGRLVMQNPTCADCDYVERNAVAPRLLWRSWQFKNKATQSKLGPRWWRWYVGVSNRPHLSRRGGGQQTLGKRFSGPFLALMAFQSLRRITTDFHIPWPVFSTNRRRPHRREDTAYERLVRRSCYSRSQSLASVLGLNLALKCFGTAERRLDASRDERCFGSRLRRRNTSAPKQNASQRQEALAAAYFSLRQAKGLRFSA
jgi:hypothetical protein